MCEVPRQESKLRTRFREPLGREKSVRLTPRTFRGNSSEYPRQESNLRTRFRKPLLYPLSYGGSAPV
jgi:hypothetical protein